MGSPRRTEGEWFPDAQATLKNVLIEWDALSSCHLAGSVMTLGSDLPNENILLEVWNTNLLILESVQMLG